MEKTQKWDEILEHDMEAIAQEMQKRYKDIKAEEIDDIKKEIRDKIHIFKAADFEKPFRKQIIYGKEKVKQKKCGFKALETITEKPAGEEEIRMKMKIGGLVLELKKHYRWPKTVYGPFTGGMYECGRARGYETAELYYKDKEIPMKLIKKPEDFLIGQLDEKQDAKEGYRRKTVLYDCLEAKIEEGKQILKKVFEKRAEPEEIEYKE